MVINLVINEKTGKWAIYGGALLGGGGGGDIEEGLRILDMALSYAPDIPLWSLSAIDREKIIITASLVGSPASEDRYVAPHHYHEVYRLFRQHLSEEIGGIITNEIGAQSSTNGWVLAAMTGLPLIDAPCNGRAHPTAVMGSMGLTEETGYRSIQAAMGGKADKETAMVGKGTLETLSSLVRSTSIAAGGFVTVLRNPVKAGYVAKHAAIGALANSIEVGRVLYDKLGKAHLVIKALQESFGFEKLYQGTIVEKNLTSRAGFDLGSLTIAGDGLPLEVTFWNEYMTVEQGKERLATFPDLIALLDGVTGLPLTSAQAKEKENVALVKLRREKLILGSSMANPDLYLVAENTIKKDIIKYVF